MRRLLPHKPCLDKTKSLPLSCNYKYSHRARPDSNSDSPEWLNGAVECVGTTIMTPPLPRLSLPVPLRLGAARRKKGLSYRYTTRWVDSFSGSTWELDYEYQSQYQFSHYPYESRSAVSFLPGETVCHCISKWLTADLQDRPWQSVWSFLTSLTGLFLLPSLLSRQSWADWMLTNAHFL